MSFWKNISVETRPTVPTDVYRAHIGTKASSGHYSEPSHCTAKHLLKRQCHDMSLASLKTISPEKPKPSLGFKPARLSITSFLKAQHINWRIRVLLQSLIRLFTHSSADRLNPSAGVVSSSGASDEESASEYPAPSRSSLHR